MPFPRPLALALALAAVCLPATVAAAKSTPEGRLTPGVVVPPPLGLTLHDDVVEGVGDPASASVVPVAAGSEDLTTASGNLVTVKVSTGYTPDPAYNQELVAFLDSLLHGDELTGLIVFVVLPSEMSGVCGGPAAACYFPKRNTMYIVGEASYGGFPTSYVVAHEYGHRIAAKRRNTPFGGGALAWGTKRWATQERVCNGFLQGRYFPGSQGKEYFKNPGEAFAEAYAWYDFGPNLVEWEFIGSLRPNAAAYEAIERDVLEPWAPTVSELQGRLARPGARKVYPLRIENDGLLKVQMSAGGDLDVGLMNARGQFVAASIRPGTGQERFNFTVCGERKLKLVVEAVRLPGDFRLQVSQP